MVGFAGWRLRLIRPTGAICLRDGYAGWRLRLIRPTGAICLGFGFAGWRLRLIRPTGAICRGFWFFRMAATPYPAYGCDMPGFGFAGWRLRLIRPTVTKLLKPRRPDKRLRAIRQWDRAQPINRCASRATLSISSSNSRSSGSRSSARTPLRN